MSKQRKLRPRIQTCSSRKQVGLRAV